MIRAEKGLGGKEGGWHKCFELKMEADSSG